MEKSLEVKDKNGLKEALVKMEQYRNAINERNDYPPSDYHVRVCQGIIANLLGFEHRIEWNNDKYLGFETKL